MADTFEILLDHKLSGKLCIARLHIAESLRPRWELFTKLKRKFVLDSTKEFREANDMRVGVSIVDQYGDVLDDDLCPDNWVAVGKTIAEMLELDTWV